MNRKNYPQKYLRNVYSVIITICVCVKKFVPAVLLLALSCIEPYEPPLEQYVLDMLVVEGFMNASDGTAKVKLSHTLTISDTNSPTPELNASVSIWSSNGSSYFLSEQDSGRYLAKDLIIDKNQLYTLHIKTTSGKEYASDTIRVKETPTIDSLNFGISNDGQNLTILVNTHDVQGKSRYYSWDFIETYEYNAALYSGFHFINKEPVFRKQEESIYTCWRTVPSTSISIGTTSDLAEDVIKNHVITYISKTSPKISVRYSILVKQKTISSGEHDYLEQLRKTTESLGGIFGTTPTTVIGNIHELNNSRATVLGYFSGAEVKEKRFFIDRNKLPKEFVIQAPKEGCILEQTCDLRPPPSTGPQSCVPLSVVSNKSIIINAITPEGGGNPTAYTFTSPECGDCRTKGGTTKTPEFW